MKRTLKTCTSVVLIAIMVGSYMVPAFLFTKLAARVDNMEIKYDASDILHESVLAKIIDKLRVQQAGLAVMCEQIKIQQQGLAANGKLTAELKAELELAISDVLMRISALDAEIQKAQLALFDLKNMPTIARQYMENSLLSTVKVISAYDKYGKGSGSGTAIMVDETGTYILTAAHVVADYDPNRDWSPSNERKPLIKAVISAEVFYNEDGTTEEFPAELIKIDEASDLALLRVPTWKSPHTVKVMSPLDFAELTPLDDVYVSGCPLGLSPRVTTGKISATTLSEAECIETTCAIIFGNSGGGLFYGDRLIGVASKVAMSGYQAITHLGIFVNAMAIETFLTDTPCAME